MGPSIEFCQRIGNSYTASSFVNLLCLVSNQQSQLIDQRVGVFSYGSGAVGTLYTLQGARGHGNFTLDNIASTANLRARLDGRQRVPVEEFVDAMALRVHSYGRHSHHPIGEVGHVAKGDFYLHHTTGKHHRVYARA